MYPSTTKKHTTIWEVLSFDCVYGGKCYASIILSVRYIVLALLFRGLDYSVWNGREEVV